MNKNQMSLGQAKKLFGLWDNAYHANGLKNLDPARRWDPTKMSKLIMKKGGESSSDEETDGMYIKFTISIQNTDIYLSQNYSLVMICNCIIQYGITIFNILDNTTEL